MQVELTKYNLPDVALLQKEEYDFMVWQPKKDVIVIGQSNKLEEAVNVEEVYTDYIQVMKRPSGGETVVLSPKTLVVSAVVIEEKLSKPHHYFEIFNTKVMKALKAVGVKGVVARGISDLALGDKKILGSSIYRTGNKLFYHAVINIAESPRKIERYLSHPSREPDYRKGRRHSEFITSLFEEGFYFEISDLHRALDEEFEKKIEC